MAFNGEIGHLVGIESPWANAGGVAKTTEDVEQLSKTGVGWVEDGSQPLLKRLGNGWNPETGMRDKKDWDYNPDTGEMHNSLGMPCEGFDILEPQIPERVSITNAHNKKYVLNVAPVSDKPAEESLELIQRGYAAGADGVLLNAGCPNVKAEDGKNHKILSKSPEAFRAVLAHLANAELPKPIWVRISPQESWEAMQVLCDTVKASGIVSAVLTPNTWSVPMPHSANGEPLLEVDLEFVGKSGPAIAKQAALETAWAVHYLKGSKVDVISSSGIMNAQELRHRLGIGAVGGCGTTFYYESQNGWSDDTDRLLSELAA